MIQDRVYYCLVHLHHTAINHLMFYWHYNIKIFGIIYVGIIYFPDPASKMGMRTVHRLGSSPTDTSPRTLPRRTFPRMDISPTLHFLDGDFPDWTFPH